VGFLAELFGAYDVLTLIAEKGRDGWWVGHSYHAPVEIADQPRTIVSAAGLAYGTLQYSLWGRDSSLGLPTWHDALQARAEMWAEQLLTGRCDMVAVWSKNSIDDQKTVMIRPF
jgi:hypothetical protein